jgi:ComF family protein
MPGLFPSPRFLLRSLGDFLFPPRCYGCDQEIEEGLLCERCNTRLFADRVAVCPACGRPLTGKAANCGRCDHPFSPVRVRALGPYVPPYSSLIHALKYEGKTVLASVLGQALVALAESDPDLSSADILCPVPLHRSRLRERGFNQSVLLAREVASGTGKTLAEPLRRVLATRTQTRLEDDDARIRNVRRAFDLRTEASLDGERVVLVDDVTTSGATLDAAGRQLLKAGASSVFGLVVAAA